MNLLLYLLLGTVVSIGGSILPSMLNMTVVKFSLKSGRKSAVYVAVGISLILIIQSSIAIYLSDILMRNTEYINTIQKVATVIFFLISIHFFRISRKSKYKSRKERIQKSTAFFHGIVLSFLNVFAIPFYFTVITFLIAGKIFEFSYLNALFFSLGAALGTFMFLGIYAFVAKKIEFKLHFLATKMDFILGCLTGFVALGNTAYIFINS